jgi:hypothetical protein
MHDDLMRTIVIPTLASLITGLLVGMLILCLVFWRSWPAIWAAIGGLAAALLTWWAWSARFARVLEVQLTPDLPQPDTSQVIEPLPEVIHLRIDNERPGGYIDGQFIELPTDPDRLRRLASGLTNGAPLSVHNWTGSRAVFTRHEFETIRVELERRGLAENRGGNIGFTLTAPDRAIMRKLASSTTPPDEMP